MMGIIGLVAVFVMVFGGYMLHGGELGVIIAALPTELMVIFGGATGAMIIGNSMETMKGWSPTSRKSSPGPSGRSRTSRTCSASCSRSRK